MNSKLDLNALAIDDIIEEYKILHKRHLELKEQSEKDAQTIHDLKRNLDTAVAAELFLTQELEQLGSATEASPSVEPQELEDLRRKYKNLQLEHENLQQDHETKVQEANELKLKLKHEEREWEMQVHARLSNVHEECQIRFNAQEQANAELMQKMDDYDETRIKFTFELAEKEKKIDILQDQVSCLEQNLNCKRDELEEKLQLLESCQEQLVDANARIALLTSAPELNDRKGNSLFAEVDDQRQAMKQLLAAQKKSYLQMKKTYTESNFEIHRLKKENIAMHTELQACSTIFCNADRTYQKKLNERIRQLVKQNTSLQKQLNLSQQCLRQLGSEKSVIWLDSILDFCKHETDDLKVELHSLRMQNASLDEQMRNSQQNMARWRFEALKSRCVLIDRENLLTEHKIAFKPKLAMEFNIKEAELKAALPRIAPVPESPAPTAIIDEVIILDTPIKPKVKEEAPLKETETTDFVQEMPVETQNEQACKSVKQENPIKYRSCLMKTKPQVKMECADQLPQDLALPINLSEPDQPIEASKPLKKGTPIKIRLGSYHTEEEEELKSVKPQSEQPVKQETLINQRSCLLKNKPHVKIECEKQLSQDLALPINLNEPDKPIDTLIEASKPLKKGTPIKTRLGSHHIQSDSESNEEEEQLKSVETAVKPLKKGTPVKPRAGLINVKSNDQLMENRDLKAQFKVMPAASTPIKMLEKRLPKGTSMQDINNHNVRSILIKKHDVFAESNQKMVKFSSGEPLVHKLSPCEDQTSAKSSKENEKPITSNNCIIRRIVVSSRKPTK